MLRTTAEAKPREQCDPEQGSIAIALMVMMIIALLGASALAQSQSSLHNVQQQANRATANGGAERGLAEAVSRLEHGEAPPFAGRGQLNDGTFSYEVTSLNSTTAEIYAEAEVDGARRAVEATVNGTLKRGYSIFATGRIISDNNDGSVTGRVGTNGEFRVSGQALGDEQEIFSPNGDCLNCPNLIKSDGPLEFPEPVLPTGPSRPCDYTALFLDTLDGKNGLPYVCTGPGLLIFYRNQEIKNPPLVIYASEEREVIFYLTSLNRGGEPSDFQLYLQSNPRRPSSLRVIIADMSAQLYAPGRDIQPYYLTLEGSLIVKDLQINRGWVLNAAPDKEAIGQAVTNWQLTHWQDVPAR